jgi:hypothetical protein
MRKLIRAFASRPLAVSIGFPFSNCFTCAHCGYRVWPIAPFEYRCRLVFATLVASLLLSANSALAADPTVIVRAEDQAPIPASVRHSALGLKVLEVLVAKRICHAPKIGANGTPNNNLPQGPH